MQTAKAHQTEDGYNHLRVILGRVEGLYTENQTRSMLQRNKYVSIFFKDYMLCKCG